MSSLTVRQIVQADLPEISKWYGQQGDPLEYEALPADSFFVVENNGKLLASGALLLTNGKSCFMEHLATNHALSELDQGRGLVKLAKTLETLSKSLGYKYILGFTPEDHFPLARFYERQGSKRFAKLMRLFVKTL